jgi:2-polyprenyl-6-methoxyphenol hydroxylase-like FAD-dependent oxidoreductase
MTIDVLVVGAGPTGLLLANELELAGADVRVIDRLERRTGPSKALNLQPRSAEILDLRGHLGPLLDQANGRIPAGHFAGIPLDYNVFATKYPYQIGIPQAKVEAHLEQHLGTSVHYGHQLDRIEQDETGVTAYVNGAAIRARYVVGCDGGRSTVRKLLGVPFSGRDPRMCAIVADVTLEGADGPTEWRLPDLAPRNGGVVSILPIGDGVYRLLAAGPAQQVDRDTPISDDEIAAALEPHRLGKVRWAGRFTDASRQVDSYRTGRVLLAGDAAHIHTPTGGQGLNLGLQDAFNLGWKLAATVQGWAPPGLLGTYHDERHPAGARVLANTRAQGILMVPDDDVTALRTIFTELAALPEANRYLAGLISGLGSGDFLPDPDLIPLFHKGKFLLVYGNEKAIPSSDHLVAVNGTTPMLIRPDGYVAWRSGDGPLDAALRTWIGTAVDTVHSGQ